MEGKYKMIETGHQKFFVIRVHSWSQTLFSKIIRRGLGPKVFPGQ